MKPCPLPLKVLCIIGIIWAGLGILSVLVSLSFQFITFPSTPPAAIAMRHEPLVMTMTFGLGFAAIVIDAILLAGCIKSLKVDPSGRTLLLTYVWTKLVISFISAIWSFAYIMPRTFEVAIPAGRPTPPGFEAALRVGLVIGGCGSIVFLLLMPAYVLITLQLKNVRDAYNGLFVPAGDFEPVLQPPQQ